MFCSYANRVNAEIARVWCEAKEKGQRPLMDMCFHHLKNVRDLMIRKLNFATQYYLLNSSKEDIRKDQVRSWFLSPDGRVFITLWSTRSPKAFKLSTHEIKEKDFLLSITKAYPTAVNAAAGAPMCFAVRVIHFHSDWVYILDGNQAEIPVGGLIQKDVLIVPSDAKIGKLVIENEEDEDVNPQGQQHQSQLNKNQDNHNFGGAKNNNANNQAQNSQPSRSELIKWALRDKDENDPLLEVPFNGGCDFRIQLPDSCCPVGALANQFNTSHVDHRYPDNESGAWDLNLMEGKIVAELKRHNDPLLPAPPPSTVNDGENAAASDATGEYIIKFVAKQSGRFAATQPRNTEFPYVSWQLRAHAPGIYQLIVVTQRFELEFTIDDVGVSLEGPKGRVNFVHLTSNAVWALREKQIRQRERKGVDGVIVAQARERDTVQQLKMLSNKGLFDACRANAVLAVQQHGANGLSGKVSFFGEDDDDDDADLKVDLSHEYRKGHPFTPVEMLLSLRETGVNVMPESADLGLVLEEVGEVLDDMNYRVAALLAAERKAKKAQKLIAAVHEDVVDGGDGNEEGNEEEDDDESALKKKKVISSRRPLSIAQAEAEARNQAEQKRKLDEEKLKKKFVDIMKERTGAINALSCAAPLYCHVKDRDVEVFACKEIAHACSALDFASSDANRFIASDRVLVRMTENPFHEDHIDPGAPDFKSDFRSVLFHNNDKVQFVDVDLNTPAQQQHSDRSLDESALEQIALQRTKTEMEETKLAKGDKAQRHELAAKKHAETIEVAPGSLKVPGLVVSPSEGEGTHIDLAHSLKNAGFGVSPLVIPMIENIEHPLAKENVRLMLLHMRLLSFG